MDIDEHIEVLEIEGRRFVDAAVGAGFGATVPTCPGWTVRDLTVHLGAAHRWAEKVVSQKLQSGADAPIGEFIGSAPDDDAGLVQWLLDGHAALIEALRNGSPADDFWRFMRNAPSSLAFWTRRQAHETTMHRVDADLAGTAGSLPIDPTFAADGVDELLLGFAPRKKLSVQPPITVLLEATDAERMWWTRLADGVAVVTEGIDPDLAPALVSGSVDAIYRFSWNRMDASDPELTLTGDRELVDAWQAHMAV